MKHLKYIFALSALFLTLCSFAAPKPAVKGSVILPGKWTMFILPEKKSKFIPSQADLKKIPATLVYGKQKLKSQTVESKDCTIDLGKIFGKDKIDKGALLYLEIDSAKSEFATLGFGADWWFTAWFNGKKIADTGLEGNKAWPPAITNYPVEVPLKKGKNLLVVKFVSGSGTSILKVGGPVDLRKVPANRWDVQYTPKELRRHYTGLKLEAVPQTIRMKDAVIVLPAKPTVQEKKAAEELANYLQKITGKKLQIIPENDKMTSNVIYVGKTKYAAGKNVGFDAFDEEQWLNRTVEGNLILGGGGTRGTLYAVWRFLEDSCGVRWWTPYEETVPSNPGLQIAPINKQGKPAFSIRIFDTHDRLISKSKKESLWAPRNRVNGELHWTIPFEYGGSMDFGKPGFVHTEGAYLVQMKRMKILKPEWCALKKGKRGGKNNFLNQLCFSNREMRKAFIGLLRKFIESDRKNNPNPPKIYNISFNDTSSRCECADCVALNRKYGCDTGLLMEFLNEIAKDIAEDYPEIKIATLAYMNTEPVPLGIKPADNVIITFTDTLSNYIKPIPEDDRFGRLLKNWSKVTNNLMIWDYHSNFADKCQPMPFESTIQTDWQLMKKNSAIGIFTEYYPVFEDLHSWRLYLMAKLAEDPFLDQQQLLLDFTNGYYGKAGTFIRKYILLVNDAARNDDISHVSTQSPMERCRYINPALVVKMQKMFDKAEQAVKGNKILLERVRHARLAADKAAYLLYAKLPKGTIKDTKNQIEKRIRETVKNRCAIISKDALPNSVGAKRLPKAQSRFLNFLETTVLWDNCDNIDRKTWAQRAWRPKSFAPIEIGKLTPSTKEKVSGKGSIRFEVSYEDVQEKLKKMPKLDRVGFNYLHGSDFSRYTAYEFYLKCDSDKHPEIYVAIGYTKWVKILNRNQKTNGWKKFTIPCKGLMKKPCTHTYFRLFATPKGFKPGDKIDLYIDEMKLHCQ